MPKVTAAASAETWNGDRRSRRGRLAVLLLVLLAGAPWLAWGATSDAPGRRAILTVGGAVARDGGTASFTREELEQLGTVDLTTTTPFTEGEIRFTGVPLETVLQAVGARGDSVRATALNDYKVDIPRSDAKEFGVLLATRVDGRPLPIRDKGPIWVVYPWSQHPELKSPVYGSRSIWQVRSLEVR